MSENVLKYRGYTASIEFDASDNILVGRVLGIRHVIDFHGADPAAVRAEFKNAIDGYLATCKKAGIEPNRPHPDKITVPLPLNVSVALAQVGARTGQSPRDLILDAVKTFIFPPRTSRRSESGGRCPPKRRRRRSEARGRPRIGYRGLIAAPSRTADGCGFVMENAHERRHAS
jgi:predicted HicB family RNase H-like nuclease